MTITWFLVFPQTTAILLKFSLTVLNSSLKISKSASYLAFFRLLISNSAFKLEMSLFRRFIWVLVASSFCNRDEELSTLCMSANSVFSSDMVLYSHLMVTTSFLSWSGLGIFPERSCWSSDLKKIESCLLLDVAEMLLSEKKVSVFQRVISQN